MSVRVVSVNQLRARMTNAHRDALRNLAAGRPLMCGRTAQNTLLKWGAIENGEITALGKELLSRIGEGPNGR